MTAPIADRKKAVNYVRALVRWIAPWEDEGKSFLIVYTGIFFTLILGSLAFGSTDAAHGLAQLAWFLIKLYLVYRLVISMVFILPLLIPSRRASAIEVLGKIWQEKGEPRLFDQSRSRRADLRGSRAFLRDEGFNWGAARKIARECVLARRHY